jgi:hypothetical protein
MRVADVHHAAEPPEVPAMAEFIPGFAAVGIASLRSQ